VCVLWCWGWNPGLAHARQALNHVQYYLLNSGWYQKFYTLVDLLSFLFFLFFFWDKVSLCRLGWPQTHDPPASVFRVLLLQVCTSYTTISIRIPFCLFWGFCHPPHPLLPTPLPVLLGFDLHASSPLLGRCFTTWTMPPALFALIILEIRSLFARAGLDCSPLILGF
jgi:hypothetical protein